MYIFKDVALTLKPHIIQALSNSDSAVVWVDIWDLQNSSIIKSIINRCFNIGKYITTICSTNMNLGVPQCKNCWKWDHSTLICWLYIYRCSKYYEPHNIEHHREKVWCCKENKNSKPPRLIIKEGEPCTYIFKCINYKEDYQADSFSYLYWRNCFNKEWYGRKQQELNQG